MKRKRWVASLLILIVLVFSACQGREAQEEAKGPPAAVTPPSVEAPGAPGAGGAAATPPAGQGAAPATAFADGVRYAAEAAGRSSDPILGDLALEVRWVERSGDTLLLRLAFVNQSDEKLVLTGDNVDFSEASLQDGRGQQVSPLEGQPLPDLLSPPGGFAPGSAQIIDLRFPLPGGPGPYTLSLPRALGYPALTFQPGGAISAEAGAPLPEGDHLIEQQLYATQAALQPIALQIRGVQVRADVVVLELAFVNTGRKGYRLLQGPRGADAWLIDAEGRQYAPTAVSESLQTSIGPQEGWEPGQAYEGSITFARPAAGGELRFLFDGYSALALRPGASGGIEAAIVSAAGGSPPPTPAPDAEEAAFAEVNGFLSRLGEALAAGDRAAYLAGFAEPLRAEQEAILTRMAALPVENLTFALDPAARLRGAAQGRLSSETMLVRYTLRGLPEDNPFSHDLTLRMERAVDGWQITRVQAGENPPFWWTGDVVAQSSEHFLLLARPELAGVLDAYAAETEAAYTALLARGLPLEPRYAAFFTATQADFRAMTGQGQRTLGVALSRYLLQEETIQVINRAFYINGAAHDRPGLTAEDRQTTITHELVHLALANQSRPFTPPWLAEGAAFFFAGQSTPEARASLLQSDYLEQLSLAELTRASALGEHDVLGITTTAQYTFSGETFAYLTERFGQEAALAFYAAYTQVPASQVRERMPRFGGSFATNAAFNELQEELTRRLLEEHFQMTLEQLDAAVREWIGAPVQS